MWWLLVIGLLFTGLACWKLISLFKAEVPKTCGNCKHWDLKEGQLALRNAPLFADGVAPHVSPQRMMQRFDEDGNPLKQSKILKPSENNWGAIGLCTARGETERCTHKAFVCDQWAKCPSRKGVQL